MPEKEYNQDSLLVLLFHIVLSTLEKKAYFLMISNITMSYNPKM